MTTPVPLSAVRVRPSQLTPAQQAAIENALTMALHFVRQPACQANLWAATSRATRAATMLKHASGSTSITTAARG